MLCCKNNKEKTTLTKQKTFCLVGTMHESIDIEQNKKFINSLIENLENLKNNNSEALKDLKIMIAFDSSPNYNSKNKQIVLNNLKKLQNKCKEYGVKFSVIRNEKQGFGFVAPMRNRTIDLMDAKYFSWFDGDDPISSDYLITAFEQIQNNDIDIFVPNNYNKSGFFDGKSYNLMANQDNYNDINITTVWGVIYKTSVIQSNKYLRFPDTGSEDHEFCKKVVLLKNQGLLKVQNMNNYKPLEYYSPSFSTKTRISSGFVFAALEIIYDYLKVDIPDDTILVPNTLNYIADLKYFNIFLFKVALIYYISYDLMYIFYPDFLKQVPELYNIAIELGVKLKNLINYEEGTKKKELFDNFYLLLKDFREKLFERQEIKVAFNYYYINYSSDFIEKKIFELTTFILSELFKKEGYIQNDSKRYQSYGDLVLKDDGLDRLKQLINSDNFPITRNPHFEKDFSQTKVVFNFKEAFYNGINENQMRKLLSAKFYPQEKVAKNQDEFIDINEEWKNKVPTTNGHEYQIVKDSLEALIAVYKNHQDKLDQMKEVLNNALKAKGVDDMTASQLIRKNNSINSKKLKEVVQKIIENKEKKIRERREEIQKAQQRYM